MAARTKTKRLSRCLPVVAITLLAGCGDDGSDELRRWMDDVRRQTPVSVQKIPAPTTFTPFMYSGKEELDPYNPGKLMAAFAKLEASPKSGIQPDLKRRKEPLESFPLDTITMVGTLQRPGLTYAVLRVDRNVFQAKVGNYIGQNFGMITKISESEVELREVVRDAAGEWTERNATLELQESDK